MIVAIGADHGGFEYKQYIKETAKGIDGFVDCGAFEFNAEDSYVDFAIKVAETVRAKKADLGVFICRTGVGASIVMNKVPSVYCGLAENIKSVKLARQKNNINCLTFGADNVSKEKAVKIVETFIKSCFEGGRHQKRVDAIKLYEKKQARTR